MRSFPRRTVPVSVRIAAALAFLAALLCLAPAATATTKTWIAGSGQWDTSANWSPSGQPQAGDDVYLTQSDGFNRTVTYVNMLNPGAVLSSLKIDATSSVPVPGTMTLNMPTSHTLNVTTEYVGYNGKGTVTQSAGTNSAATLYLGNSALSNGSYTITGGTLSSSASQYIGYSGTGTLNIQNGGQVSNCDGYLAYNPGSNGTVTVDGSGSKWTNSGNLYVGFSGGTGTLNIQNGGQVSNTVGYLGRYNSSGCEGTATVNGIGSRWNNAGGLYVGNSGLGVLNIQNGGQVCNTDGYLGHGRGTVTVDGIGSDWTNSGGLYVGNSGMGVLNIQNGGQVSNTNGYIGYDIGSLGLATVDGSGSLWNNTGSLYVGGSSTDANGAGSVTVQNGGQLTVGGTLKLWNTGSLTVSDGGSVTAGHLIFSGGTLRLTGTSFTVTAGDLAVDNGTVDTADLAATFTCGQTIHGFGRLTKAGVGTLVLSVANTYYGGTTVSAGTLLVGNTTGSATGTGAVTVGAATLGGTGFINGPVTLTGGATLTSTGTLTINNTLTVQGMANRISGGQVYNTTGSLGYSSGSTGTVTVEGVGSTWTNSGYLYIGYSGTGTLNIQNGGQVSNTYGYLGYSSSSSGTATVDGSGSVWNSRNLYVGYSGTGTLNIQKGGQVSNNGYDGYLGYSSGSKGTATVDGANSKWTYLTNLYVGNSGTGILSIQNGGQVFNGIGYLGYNHGSSGTATVDGTNSNWTIQEGSLYVGYSGTGALNIQNGGQVSNGMGYLGCSSGSSGTATVDGTGSKWTNSAELYVGLSGTGTLNIQNSGQVSNTNGYLGYYSGSGGTATVDGIGSLWTNTGSLYVGGSDTSAGGTGSVTVQNGGQLVVGGTLRLWKADSAVTVSGGALTAGALAGPTGTIRITDPAGGTALTVGSDASDAFSGVIRDDTGPGSLTKVGGGTQTLGGANAYTGATTVSGGTLQIAATGSINNTSGITVAGGAQAIFVGAPTLGGTIDVSGTFTAGAASQAGTFNLSAGGTANVTGGLNGTGAGAATLAAGSTFNATGATSMTGWTNATLNTNVNLNGGALGASGTVAIGGGASFAAGAVTANNFNVNSGSATMTTLAGANPATSTVSVAAGQTLNVDKNILNVHTLTVDGTATLHGLATEGTANETSIVRSLVMNKDGGGKPLGTLDLKTGNLVVDYTGGSSPLVEVANLVKSGANFNPGTGNLQWNGTGITSSIIPTGPDPMLYAVGVREAVDAGSFAMPTLTNLEGVTLGSKAVVAKYTWIGDVNLDGVVTQDDYDVMDYYQVFGTEGEPFGAGWWTGDLNGDGKLNQDDYDLADYGQVFQDGSTLGRAHSMPDTAPEPATLGLMALGGLALLGSRRK